MTQISTKKNAVSQATPLVKKKNSVRRSSRSRSRARYSRRLTPPRTLSQTVKENSVEKLLPITVHHPVTSVVKEDSASLKNEPLQKSMDPRGTAFGEEKLEKLSSATIDHSYIVTLIHLFFCALFAFVIYVVVNYFGFGRFVIKQWSQWSKKGLLKLAT